MIKKSIEGDGKEGKQRSGKRIRKCRHSVLDGAAAGVPSRCVGKATFVDSEGNALGHLCLRALAPVVGAPWGIMLQDRK